MWSHPYIYHYYLLFSLFIYMYLKHQKPTTRMEANGSHIGAASQKMEKVGRWHQTKEEMDGGYSYRSPKGFKNSSFRRKSKTKGRNSVVTNLKVIRPSKLVKIWRGLPQRSEYLNEVKREFSLRKKINGVRGSNEVDPVIGVDSRGSTLEGFKYIFDNA